MWKKKLNLKGKVIIEWSYYCYVHEKSKPANFPSRIIIKKTFWGHRVKNNKIFVYRE